MRASRPDGRYIASERQEVGGDDQSRCHDRRVCDTAAALLRSVGAQEPVPRNPGRHVNHREPPPSSPGHGGQGKAKFLFGYSAGVWSLDVFADRGWGLPCP
jgi:hypothetical protein